MARGGGRSRPRFEDSAPRVLFPGEQRMILERWQSGGCGTPFPVYDGLVDRLLEAHRGDDDERDPTVAHLLGACAGYAYADIETVTTMMSRLGLVENGCVRVAQTVEAMFIFSTADLVQSRCGRVVVLSYRGTEPSNLGNWLGNTDASSELVPLDAGPVC